MKVTTIRISEDLWGLLEHEAERAGVSVAQFIREAALARSVFAVGLRTGIASDVMTEWAETGLVGTALHHAQRTERLILALSKARSHELRDETQAVLAQSERTVERSRSRRRERRGEPDRPASQPATNEAPSESSGDPGLADVIP